MIRKFFPYTLPSRIHAAIGMTLCASLGFLLVETIYAGMIEGTVHFQGSQPIPRIMKVSKDQDHCGEEVSIRTIHHHGVHGALSDVVVSVDGMTVDFYEEPAERPVLNMRCAFFPRIGVAREGQKIEVRNQDPILHNTHIKLGKRTFLNVAQVPGGKSIVKRLNRSGLHHIRCDKHVFMEAYLHVFPHPFYALTDHMGWFRIKGIPGGSHHIRVWHETLGVLTKVVTVPPKGSIQLNFGYQ